VPLDGLLFGVAIAMLKVFHQTAWQHITEKGNILLIMGLAGCWITLYIVQNHAAFFPTAFGYTLLALSFSALTLAALSPSSWLHRIRIPAAATLASWSYAIYLTHKQFIFITYNILTYCHLNQFRFFSLIISMLVCLISGYLLYTYVEKPFLKLRDKKIGYELQHQSTL
jgi:peptidoglycan/LPS O-acetylase OafA/YrhL